MNYLMATWGFNYHLTYQDALAEKRRYGGRITPAANIPPYKFKHESTKLDYESLLAVKCFINEMELLP